MNSFQPQMPAGPAVRASDPVPFLLGRFESGSWRVPYFSVTLDLRQASTSLQTANEVSNFDTTGWQVEELYQREIDWPRVLSGVAPYLRADEAKFFNSLTVVLVPRREPGRAFDTSFPAGEAWSPPTVESMGGPFAETLAVGPMRVAFWQKATDDSGALDHGLVGAQMGVVSWNLEQLAAVAIDGQHRLAAIKEVVNTSRQGDAALSSKVSVLCLVFDERFGFVSPTTENGVKLLRSVFIDLNRHAVIPSRARQILLDDRDPVARCVRALTSGSIESDLSALAASPARLPLALVDWHSDKHVKVDTGPYLTTVLGLDWTVCALLGVSDVTSYMDYPKIRRQISGLQSKLKIDLSAASARLTNLAKNELEPFSFEDSEADAIRAAFEELYGPVVVALMTQFTPYKELLQLRDADESLAADFQTWFRLKAKQKPGDTHAFEELMRFTHEVVQRRKSVDDFQKSLDAMENLKRTWGLPFLIVFQRALVRCFQAFDSLEIDAFRQMAPGLDLNALGDLIPEEDSYMQEAEEVEFDGQAEDFDLEVTPHDPSDARRAAEAVRLGIVLEIFLGELNRLVQDERPIMQVTSSHIDADDGKRIYFWAGSIMKANQTVDFTKVAAERASDLLAAALLVRFIKRESHGTYEGFDDLWSHAVHSQEINRPALIKRLGRLVAQCASPQGFAKQVLTQEDVDYDMDRARDEVFRRLVRVWSI